MTEPPTEVEMILLTVMRKAVAEAKRSLEADLHGLSAMVLSGKLDNPALEYFQRREADTITALAQFKAYALNFEQDYMQSHWEIVRTPKPQKNAPSLRPDEERGDNEITNGMDAD